MAEKINIVQVPEVETISKLLGVDANNTWAKIPATKFASTETVESVNATANEAVTTANAAKVNADRLFGMARSVYVVPLNETQDYSVSALWFCNGLTDPTASLPPASEPGAYGTIACFPSGNAEVKLRLVSLSAIPEKTTAEFSCLSNAAKLTLYAGNTELGYFIRGDGESGFSYSARIVDGSIIIISAMAGCTFTPTYTGSSYWVLVASGGGDSINVDSALNLESTNPVQNKVVTSALDAKAPLASPAFTGTPTAPTPTVMDENSDRIATLSYLRKLEKYKIFSNNTYTWSYDNQYFVSSAIQGTITITAVSALPVYNTSFRMSVFHFYFNAGDANLTLNVLLNGKTFTMALTGLTVGKLYYVKWASFTYGSYATRANYKGVWMLS